MNKQFISLEEFIDFKDELVLKIKKSGIRYDQIISNLRGGFNLGLALSEDLDIPLSVCHIALRDNHKFNPLNITPLFMWIDPDKKYLFVDDLIDSGETIEQLTYKNIDVAVLFCKTGKEPKDKKVFYVQDLEEDVWLDFFWEKY